MTRKLSDVANEFAIDWHERPESDRDKTTLAHLLTDLLAQVERQAVKTERTRLLIKLTKWIDS
jgi:hypothetical protein